MSKYLDHFDVKEFELFKKFNNNFERKNRHIDTFFLDNPQETLEEKKEKAKINEEKLIHDTKQQLMVMQEYFEDVLGDNNDR